MKTPGVLILLPLCLVVGCANQAPVAPPAPFVAPVAPVAAVVRTNFVETPYAVRSYAEPANPTIRHDAQVVYRRTRVSDPDPDKFVTVPRTTYASPSVAPLPASEELAAELATQRKITAELRRLQTALTEAGQQMQTQYTVLVRQSAEALKLREQLEGERGRSRETISAVAPLVPPAPPPVNPAEVKW